jgi:hypothetical protein
MIFSSNACRFVFFQRNRTKQKAMEVNMMVGENLRKQESVKPPVLVYIVHGVADLEGTIGTATA